MKDDVPRNRETRQKGWHDYGSAMGAGGGACHPVKKNKKTNTIQFTVIIQQCWASLEFGQFPFVWGGKHKITITGAHLRTAPKFASSPLTIWCCIIIPRSIDGFPCLCMFIETIQVLWSVFAWVKLNYACKNVLTDDHWLGGSPASIPTSQDCH